MEIFSSECPEHIFAQDHAAGWQETHLLFPDFADLPTFSIAPFHFNMTTTITAQFGRRGSLSYSLPQFCTPDAGMMGFFDSPTPAVPCQSGNLFLPGNTGPISQIEHQWDGAGRTDAISAWGEDHKHRPYLHRRRKAALSAVLFQGSGFCVDRTAPITEWKYHTKNILRRMGRRFAD